MLKFDGLAAGKGVAVCMSKEEADSFLKEVFTDRRFGEGRLLVEEFLTGPEVSIFGALVDDHYLILCPARDYKRLKEGDAGPNTGGMGAVASRRLVEPEMLERIEKEIVAPTVAGLKKDGLPYRGFLYFGLMLTPNGPKVIEYNCRFGSCGSDNRTFPCECEVASCRCACECNISTAVSLACYNRNLCCCSGSISLCKLCTVTDASCKLSRT